ncbi:MAG: carbamoyltransferase HypF [Gammaproteobacteria bacterium]|nr:carbamoyltransferase HypF [Gammaproteobacteria bacterium]
MSPTRQHLEITGLVQGVGFRPFCHRLAQRFALSGWVLNHGGGVSIEIQGRRIDDFISALKSELPPLARIDSIEQKDVPPEVNESEFLIRESLQSAVTAAIPPDSSVCPDCLRELFDPASRYYRYPFLNCTQCGPRYTVTRALPYDRANTSMAAFKLCPACQAEYDDPTNRRFHAQPTACPSCGPRLSMSADEIVHRLRDGEILAIKGLGGFHLVCDARNHDAVARLRIRKQREAKPFAVMAANLASLETLVELDDPTRALLESPQRPIVLAKQRSGAKLSPAIAPGLDSFGVVLPYTPLHYLIFNAAVGNPDGTEWLQETNDLALVMTSANPGGEPLVIGNDEARERLGSIADTLVDHDRDIVCRCDDSVLRITAGKARFIRRARSYVPEAIKLPHEIPSVLAVGGHLKNTICVTRGDRAYLSQHIGSLDNRATYAFFEEIVQHLLDTLQVKPAIVAHDLHPDFFSTRYAQELGLKQRLPTMAVQHHHAHLGAVAAEHGVTEAAIGLALDGFGLGENNESWGGELMLFDGAEYQRLGHLAPMKQPGADRAAREPWRMAAAVYDRLGRGEEIERRFPQTDTALLRQMLSKNLNCPATSSAGRLFDAAAGLLGVKAVSDYEGQAAMMLEGLTETPETMTHGWRIEDNRLDLLPLLERLIDCDPVTGANLFHGTLIAALTDWIEQTAEETKIKTVLLGGGCFLNQVLSSGLMNELTAKGYTVKLSQQAPCNDGGLSLGQAWIAGLRRR